MVKKNKSDAAPLLPEPRSIPNRDIMQRLNFMYQASVYLNQVNLERQGSSSSSTLDSVASKGHDPTEQPSSSKKHVRASRRSKSRIRTTGDLAKLYVSNMRVVAQKTVVRMDPAVKRSICRRCGVVLVIGENTSVRVKKSNYHRHAVSYSCLQCRSSRRVPAPPGFLDPPDAIENKAGSKQEGGTEQEHVVGQEQRPLEDQRQHLGGIGIPSGDRTYVRTNHLPLALRLGAGHVVFCGNERLGS